MVAGASVVVMGCGGGTTAEKAEATSEPAVSAPPKKLTGAELRALNKKKLTEDEPSAQERRRAKLKSKTGE